MTSTRTAHTICVFAVLGVLPIATPSIFAQLPEFGDMPERADAANVEAETSRAGRGHRRQVGEAGAWKGTIAGTTLDGLIYSVEQDGALYATDPSTGRWRPVGHVEFHDTRHLFALGPDLYTIESTGSLFRVRPTDGSWEQVGAAGAWRGTIAGTILDEALYTVEANGALYVTDLATGRWRQIGPNVFHGTTHLFAVGSDLYTIESSGSLYQVNPANGSWKQMGPAGAWQGTLAGAVLGDALYTVEANGALYVTDPATGTWQQLGDPDYADTRLLLAIAGRLFALEHGGSLFAIVVP